MAGVGWSSIAFELCEAVCAGGGDGHVFGVVVIGVVEAEFTFDELVLPGGLEESVFGEEEVAVVEHGAVFDGEDGVDEDGFVLDASVMVHGLVLVSW